MIHGAWHGGWCFDPLRQRLEDEGHGVFTPDLPGMGGDDAALGRVTLEDWGQFAADMCAAQRPGSVILCGHSRGGLVISEAAEAAPEAIDARGIKPVIDRVFAFDQARDAYVYQASPDLFGKVVIAVQ